MNEYDFDVSRTEELLRRRGLTRRDLVKLGASVPLALGIARLATPTSPARAASTENGSPIAKRLPPEWFVNFGTNAEMRWDAMAGLGYTTPNERFFVRDHTARRPSTHRRGRSASSARAERIACLVHLRATPGAAAEGGRVVHRVRRQRPSFFGSQQGTPASGTQWGLGAMGVAEWRGVPSPSPRPRRHRPRCNRRDALRARQQRRHSRHRLRPRAPSNPAAKALDNAVIALEMNGQPLPADHGFPARLIVPGWIGVANIKWIGQIEVSRQPLTSLWNTQQYVMTGPSYPTTPLLTTQVVKSAWELARGATFAAGTPQLSTVEPGPAKPESAAWMSASTGASPGAQRSSSTAAARAAGRGSPIPFPPSQPAATSSGHAPPTTTTASNPPSLPSTPPATSSAQSSATQSLSARWETPTTNAQSGGGSGGPRPTSSSSTC